MATTITVTPLFGLSPDSLESTVSSSTGTNKTRMTEFKLRLRAYAAACSVPFLASDMSLLCYGAAYYLCLEAAEALHQDNIDAEIVDLRTLKPLDMDTVSESIQKTHRAVIVHEACVTGGFGAELAARIQDELFDVVNAVRAVMYR